MIGSEKKLDSTNNDIGVTSFILPGTPMCLALPQPYRNNHESLDRRQKMIHNPNRDIKVAEQVIDKQKPSKT